MSSAPFQSSLVTMGDQQVVTVLAPGHAPQVASNTHPNFRAIVAACAEAAQAAAEGREANTTAEEALRLFDVGKVIEDKFQKLSLRVSVKGGKVYFDGDEVNSYITESILRLLEAGEDVQHLVNFWERVESNPQDHSKQQLLRWLDTHVSGLTITTEGMIVGYKGVEHDGKGSFQSVQAGRTASPSGYVQYPGDDEVKEIGPGRKVPNPIGGIVTMPRSEVAHDPSHSCSRGLHVATWSYAKGWGSNGAVLEVHVDPRDVVSVPNDSNSEKVRVCRYEVIGTVDKPYDGPIRPQGEEDSMVIGPAPVDLALA